MKKQLCALFALLLLLPVLALGETARTVEAPVTQSSCSIVQSGEYYLVYCFAQVYNPTDQVICLDSGMFELRNGDQLVAQQSVSQLWPYFLNPGEDGYLFDIVAFEPNEDGVVVPSLTGIEYFVNYMPVEAQYAGITLDCTARIERDELDGTLYIICELNNRTQTTAYNPSVAFGLYTDSNALLYADGMTLQNVGILAGGTTLARFPIDEVFLSQWESYNVTPTLVQAKAMFRNDSD